MKESEMMKSAEPEFQVINVDMRFLYGVGSDHRSEIQRMMLNPLSEDFHPNLSEFNSFLREHNCVTLRVVTLNYEVNQNKQGKLFSRENPIEEVIFMTEKDFALEVEAAKKTILAGERAQNQMDGISLNDLMSALGLNVDEGSKPSNS